ncbi:uncharacterized protein RHOBADRAFT_66100 [Rhodotorula graminis WP1]|uniref:SigF-like NTF2-like domain-containing protein n=1 Tax=Rhodotorula graminis (strain WP1) TaxID=578459 RepID=A0A194SBY1_RHOGW|nr:uncharacterized protein RHOBADRAFT_66100 [Rhodotorula graminis WP1]KPV76911.1 hypothetical protein RHOBADRAFT_66100 [Rhodotorula graminis WP1]
MDNPVTDIRRAVLECAAQEDANDMLQAVDKYFDEQAIFVYPLLNSPPAAGRDGVKAAYKMLRVLSYGQRFDFHSVASDRIYVEKGIEKQKLTLDVTEHLKLSFIPLPDRLNPSRSASSRASTSSRARTTSGASRSRRTRSPTRATTSSRSTARSSTSPMGHGHGHARRRRHPRQVQPLQLSHSRPLFLPLSLA